MVGTHDHATNLLLTITDILRPPDEVWQSGQVISSAPFDSQITSNTFEEVPAAAGVFRPATSVECRVPTISASKESGIHSLLQEHRATSDSAKESVLVRRDPNSQTAESAQVLDFEEGNILPSIERTDDFITKHSCPNCKQTAFQVLTHHNSTPPLDRNPASINMSNEVHASMTPISSDVRSTHTASKSPSLREKLRSVRAASRASYAARQANLEASPLIQASKSPSLIPEPLPQEEVGNSRLDISMADIPLPQPAYQTNPGTPIHPGEPASCIEIVETQVIKELEAPRVGKMEFVVSLSLPPRIRDIYVKTIEEDQELMTKFLETENTDTSLKESMELLVSKINNVSNHVDLNDQTTMTQQEAAPEDHALWAVNCSGKFQFLARLLESLRDLDFHLAIVAQRGALLNIIELFLRGNHLNYNRPDTYSQSDPNDSKGRLQITLISSGEEDSSALPKFANLVIAFDSSFNPEEAQIQSLRKHMLNVGQLSPVVHLLVYSSAEHIEKCIPKSFTGTDRLKVLVNCVAQTRQFAGELTPEEHTPEEAADEVVQFVQGGSKPEKFWPLPRPRNIQIDGLELVDQSQSSESTSRMEAQATKESSRMPSESRKRTLVCSCTSVTSLAIRSTDNAQKMEDESVTPKRQRLPDVSHISDTTLSTQAVRILKFSSWLEADFAIAGKSNDRRPSSCLESIRRAK